MENLPVDICVLPNDVCKRFQKPQPPRKLQFREPWAAPACSPADKEVACVFFPIGWRKVLSPPPTLLIQVILFLFLHRAPETTEHFDNFRDYTEVWVSIGILSLESYFREWEFLSLKGYKFKWFLFIELLIFKIQLMWVFFRENGGARLYVFKGPQYKLHQAL